VAEKAEGVLINFCCSNRIIPRAEKRETYSLFIAGYGLYLLYLHSTARDVTIQFHTVTETFIGICTT
jgi:hypothetical protein